MGDERRKEVRESVETLSVFQGCGNWNRFDALPSRGVYAISTVLKQVSPEQSSGRTELAFGDCLGHVVLDTQVEQLSENLSGVVFRHESNDNVVLQNYRALGQGSEYRLRD